MRTELIPVLPMHQAPWLSILIPVYNVAPYLLDCLHSITAQASPAIEIIVLDDCSTDNSLDMLRDFSATSPVTINILQHPHNRGLSAARNTLLDNAHGEYIWFIDSDDMMAPAAIHSLHTLIHTHVPDLVLCDFSVLRNMQRLKHCLRNEKHIRTFPETGSALMSDSIELFAGIFQKRKLHIWSKISRRSLWGTDLRFPEGQLLEDVVVTPRLCLRVKNYFYASEPWVIYRQRAGSILTTPSQKKIDDMAIACSGILDLWLQKHPQLSAAARFRFAHFCVRTYIFVRQELRKMPEIHTPDIHRYRQEFLKQIQWNKSRICWEYIKRGWISGLRRFLLEY